MIKVLVVAEVRLYRESLAEILDGVQQLCVTRAVGSCEESLGYLRHSPPDVVLLDMTMSESLAAIKQIRSVDRGITVVAFAIRELEEELLACIEAGASGWVPPEAPLEILVATILKAVRGELVCSPRMAGTLVRRVRRLASSAGSVMAMSLTPRQMQVAELIDRGFSNKEIAQELCIGLATVKVHVHNILERLQVRRRGEAVAILRRHLNRRRGVIPRI